MSEENNSTPKVVPTMRVEIRPDDLYRTILEQTTIGTHYAEDVAKYIRLARAAAWKACKAFILLQKEDHEFLISMITSNYPGKNSIDRWLSDRFAFLKPLGTGEDVYSVLSAIESGLSYDEYIALGPSIGRRDRCKSKAVVKAESIPEPRDSVSSLKKNNQALRIENSRLRKELEEARRNCAALERLVSKLRSCLTV